MTDLIKDIQRKDKKAITLLYNQYGKKLYGFAVSKWNVNEDDAWELIYKTLYKVIDVIDKYTFENESKFNGFIYQIFINNLRNNYNERKTNMLRLLHWKKNMVMYPKKKMQKKLYQKSIHELFEKTLEQFEDWKRVLLLMKAQNFSYEEISKYVNKPSEQLKVYYLRAKQILTDKVNKCVNGIEA